MLALSHFVLASSLISSSLAATFNVDVGNGGLTFNPPQVNAQAGDEVVFNFYPKNHTVTQSTLAEPCKGVTDGGDSGFMPVAAGATVRPTKRIVVPDATTPLWFFCKQGNHCQQGMVFAINPKSQEQMDTFVANAKGIAPPPTSSSTPPPAPTDATTPPPADQTTTTVPPGASETPGAPAAPGAGREIQIDVGAGGLKFTPEQVTANVGDTLVFTFKGGAHTVTQSTFAQPCIAMPNGVDSGPKPAAGLTSGFPNFTVPVTDDKPIWMFCKTGNHCAAGMVFSVNAPATGNTHDKFKAAATGGAGASISGSGSITAPGPEQTAPGNSASSLVGRASALLVAAAMAALLL